MAVEIKELIIRAVAVDDSNENNGQPTSDQVLNEDLTNHIIQTCVKEVLRVIERKSSK